MELKSEAPQIHNPTSLSKHFILVDSLTLKLQMFVMTSPTVTVQEKFGN